MDAAKRPKVGVGVVVVWKGKVLLGKRLGSHGDNTWGFPGGHLEFGESFEDCAVRELMEETGLEVNTPILITCTNDVFHDEDKHYITVYMKADAKSDDAKNLEPAKLLEWQWFKWEELPSPLFLPIQHLLESGFSV
jgi:8-oxo-dGTP diphosphatase